MGSKFIYYNTDCGLSNDIVFAVYEDKKGNYWFGTYGGLNKFDGEKFSIYTVEDGLPNNFIHSITEDKYGNLWIATESGVCKFDGQNFVAFEQKNGLLSSSVFKVLRDSKDNLWIGTSCGLVKYDGNSFTNYKTDDRLVDNFICDIAEDKKGNIWVATYTGLNKFDGEKFIDFSEDSVFNQSFLLSVFVDSRNNVWIGTGTGLIKYNGEDFIKYTVKDGMSDKCCYFITENNNYIYIGTNKGLNRFDGKDFKTYTYKDGLPSSELNQTSSLVDSKEYLWFGTIKGVCRFDSKLDKPDLNNPPVFITDLKVNNNPVDLMGDMEFEYKENYMKINYVGLCYISPERLYYQCKLEGIDNDWITTNKRSMTYPYLPAGNYTFKVKAYNKDNIPSDNFAELSFIINPPFWDTIWFKGTVIAFVLLLVLGGYWLKISSFRKRKEMLENKVQERTIELQKAYEKLLELDNLKSDFLTNVSHELRTPLMSIRSFSELLIENQDNNDKENIRYLNIILDENDRAIRLIENLLDISRIESGGAKWNISSVNLKDIVDISVDATISLAEKKKQTLNLRFNDSLPKVIGDSDRLVQVMTNLINNAIKFTPEKGKIIIGADLENEHNGKFLKMYVSDTGIGIPEEHQGKIFDKFQQVSNSNFSENRGSGLGLAICKEIIKHHGGEIWVESEPGKGSIFYFTLPIEKGT